jgi:hypothetical protein
MGSRTRYVFATRPMRLVSLAALAQARITLLSPTAHPLHPSLRCLCSLAPMRQSRRSMVVGPVVSVRSTLDDGTQAPSSGPQGRRNGNPPRLSTQRHAHGHTRTERHGESRHDDTCYRGSSLLLVGALPPRRSIKCLAPPCFSSISRLPGFTPSRESNHCSKLPCYRKILSVLINP